MLLSGLLLNLPFLAGAQSDPADAKPPAADWAELESGERIKGELISVEERKLHFDSDELGEQEIDWGDVAGLSLAKPRAVRGRDDRVHTGTVEMSGGVLRIRTADGEQVEIAQDDVDIVAYTTDARAHLWLVRVGANLALRSGNTDQQDIGANALLRRDAVFSRFETRYVGAIGRVDGEDTTNNHRVNGTLDLHLTTRVFLRVPVFEFYTDEFQNIGERFTAGAGIGYELFDTRRVDHRLALGAAAQHTRFDGGTQDTDGAVLASSNLSLSLPRDVDLDLNYALTLLATDIGRTSHATSAILGFELVDPVELDVGAYWDRIEHPPKDVDGDRPKSDDIRLTVGLRIEL
ncbi:DUF481 domain-containing protein [Myxococcota bacterium]|nr:DUF481 domain-containing protein [Myxococcota bacterium]